MVYLSSQLGYLRVDLDQVGLKFTSVLISKCFLLVFDRPCHHLQVEYLLLQSSFTDFGLNLRTLLQLVLLLFNYLYGTSQSMVVTSLFDNLLEVFDETILLFLDASIELLFLLIDRELL